MNKNIDFFSVNDKQDKMAKSADSVGLLYQYVVEQNINLPEFKHIMQTLHNMHDFHVLSDKPPTMIPVVVKVDSFNHSYPTHSYAKLNESGVWVEMDGVTEQECGSSIILWRFFDLVDYELCAESV